MANEEVVKEPYDLFESAFWRLAPFEQPFEEKWDPPNTSDEKRYQNACALKITPGQMRWSMNRQRRHKIVLIGTHFGTVVVYQDPPENLNSAFNHYAVFPRSFPLYLERIIKTSDKALLDGFAMRNLVGRKFPEPIENIGFVIGKIISEYDRIRLEERENAPDRMA